MLNRISVLLLVISLSACADNTDHSGHAHSGESQSGNSGHSDHSGRSENSGHSHSAKSGQSEKSGHSHSAKSSHKGNSAHSGHSGNVEHSAHARESDHPGDQNNSDNYVVTNFTKKTELFLEFPKLIKARRIKFVTHLTGLGSYKPIMKGRVTVVLSGGGKPTEKFTTEKISSPGIFKPVVVAKYGVKRTINIIFSEGSSYSVIHRLGIFQVFANQELANKYSIRSKISKSMVTYLKEQQWKFDFNVTGVKRRSIRSTVTAIGSLRAPSYGNIRITASATGRLKKINQAFPYIGMKVEKGQRLAEIIPTLGDAVDIASLELALKKKKAILKLARYDRRRLESLYRQGLIAKKKLIAAQSREDIAHAEFQTIERRIRQQKTGEVSLGNQTTGIILRARISGSIAHVHKVPGSHLKIGDEIFHLINSNKLWLAIKVPEHDVSQLGSPVGAWFEITGFKQRFNTLKLKGRVISIGSSIDSVTRTLPLLIEFDNPGNSLKVGMFADVHVITSIKNEVLAVPVSAVIDDNGKNIVYVQVDGEHFEGREVKIGVKDDQYVQILAGLKKGEYIVSKGGYLVRLASTSSTKVGHGHTH